MTPERWELLQATFEALLASPPEERTSRLATLADDDPALAAELARMLAADGGDASLLDAPPLRPVDSPAPRTIGRYEVLALIGQGGFGEVYRAHDPVLGREVAIKTSRVVSPELRERFAREAALAARLTHPHIATVFDYGVDGERAYMVQELLDGEDLSAVVARRAPLPLAVRLRWLAAIAGALAHAHRQGVLHRDVKPANVRLLADGRVKLLDFGIARDLAAAGTTVTGTLLGTLAYMAPEQARGAPLDARADAYGFGCVAYELLTYRRAIAAEEPAGQLAASLAGTIAPLAAIWPQCPPALAALVTGCLATDPAARPADLGAVGDELERLAAAVDPALVPAVTAAPTLLQAPPRPRRWTRAAVLAVGALGVLALAVAAGRWARRPEIASPSGETSAARTTPAREAPAPADEPPSSAATGLLAIDARPWGEIRALRDASGRLLPLPASPQTPTAIALAPGEYEVELTHPRAVAPARCRARVAAGATTPCSVALVEIAPRELLERIAR